MDTDKKEVQTQEVKQEPTQPQAQGLDLSKLVDELVKKKFEEYKTQEANRIQDASEIVEQAAWEEEQKRNLVQQQQFKSQQEQREFLEAQFERDCERFVQLMEEGRFYQNQFNSDRITKENKELLDKYCIIKILGAKHVAAHWRDKISKLI